MIWRISSNYLMLHPPRLYALPFFRSLLELLRWERDTSPAFGKDPQSVINKQIPQDFDIIIGILLHRIGSATA